MKKFLHRLKKGLIVEVITGADKGKKGRILEFLRQGQKVKVQGVRLQKKHDKKQGIQTKEGFIDCSNIRLPGQKSKKIKLAPKTPQISQSKP